MISFKGLFPKKKTAQEDRFLRIDCRGCDTVPDIGNIACIRCIGNNIVDFGEPERVLLRSGLESEFSSETVGILREISDVCCRTSVGKSGKRCDGCVLGKKSLEAEKWVDFSIENIDDVIERLSKVYVECPNGQVCVSEAKRYFIILKGKMECLSKEAAMAAYRIVGV